MVDFGRVVTAMVTPMKEDLSVDYEQAQKIANFLVDSGSDGIVVAGTTGESPTLSKNEKIDLFKAVVDAIGGKASVIAGTGTNSTIDTRELTKVAEKTGVDGVMLVTPYYNKPPQQALYDHFKEVAENTDLPVMLYNVPGRTGVNLLPSTVARLAEIDNIVALKEACGNLDQVSEIMCLVPNDFLVYSGDDSLTLPMLTLGCHGVVSVVSHVVGKQMREMINSFIEGNVIRAKEIHLKLFHVFKAMFITTSPIPVKTAMNIMGHKVGGLRKPLMPPSKEEIEIIKKALRELNII